MMGEGIEKMLDAMRPIRGTIARTFGCMTIAEQELRRAWPNKAHEPRGAFVLVVPPQGMGELDERVYRSHAHQLLEWVKVGRPLNQGTDAECLMAISKASLVAPPTSTASVLMDRLFRSVMGETVPGFPPMEPWGGAVEDQLLEMRRKLGAHRFPTLVEKKTRKRH